MKRFAWKLQRLLDVTRRREQALESELASLAWQIESLRREAAEGRASLRRQAQSLGSLDLLARMERMQVWTRCARIEEARLAGLESQAVAIHERRQQVMAKYMEVMAARKTLDRLREQAYERYKGDVLRVEQKQTDEVGSAAHARRMMMKAPAWE